MLVHYRKGNGTELKIVKLGKNADPPCHHDEISEPSFRRNVGHKDMMKVCDFGHPSLLLHLSALPVFPVVVE